MPHRVIGLWMVLVGVLGVLLVGLLVLLGRDPRAASACGPRWKRKLLATGLVLLTGVGIVGCDSNAKIASTPTSAVQDASLETLLKDPRWVEYRRACMLAESIVLGHPAAAPVLSDDKTEALATLVAARSNLDALAAGGLISPVEQDYLKCELFLLRASLDGTFVYAPVVRLSPFDAATNRIETRLPHLRSLAKLKTIPHEAWILLHERIEKDFKLVESAETSGFFGDAEPPACIRESRKHLKEIRKRCRPTDLNHSASWYRFGEDFGRALFWLEFAGADASPLSSGHDLRETLEQARCSGDIHKSLAALFEIQLAPFAPVAPNVPFTPHVELRDEVGEIQGRKIGMLMAIKMMAYRSEPLAKLAACERVRPRVVGDALAFANTDYDALTVHIPRELEECTREIAEKLAGAKGVLASVRPHMTELRRKINQCDRGISELSQQYHWLRFVRVWRRCEFMMNFSGNVSVPPFNYRGKRHILVLGQEAARRVKTLANMGLIDSDEAKMLDFDIEILSEHLGRIRSTLSYGATCYEPGTAPRDKTPEGLLKRLELFEKKRVTGKLKPKVLAAILCGMEKQLVLQWTEKGYYPSRDPNTVTYGENKKREPAEKTVAERIDRLKVALKAPRDKLPNDKRWKDVTQALRFAAKLAKSSEEVDYRDRKAAWIGVAGLQVALRQLLSEGMLTRSETVLLGYEANRLWTAAASRRSADGFFGESPVVPDDDDAEDPFKPRPSRMPWGRAGNRYESPFDMLSYPGCRSVGQWTRMLAKAVKENQISPTVLRELTLHLGAVWKSMEADLDDEIWDEDSFDDDEDADSGLF